jgi:hypothetical protein
VARPTPAQILHFTHVDHLETIVREGLLPDIAAREAELVRTDVGHQDIKAARRGITVPVPPGGVVADYVPFYYAPRSPMMYVIHRGKVSSYVGGCEDLVYLVTSVERLVELGLSTVFTDRNARAKVATFTADTEELESLVDWKLMAARMWKNTPDEPDRQERRMAECLVHGRVPWEAFDEVVAKNVACGRRVLALLAGMKHNTRISVKPGWYFEDLDENNDH